MSSNGIICATCAFLLGYVATCLTLTSVVFKRLAQKHPETYSALGRPSLFLRNSLENNLRFIRFLWKSEYSKMNDILLLRQCVILKIAVIAYIICFVIAAVVLK